MTTGSTMVLLMLGLLRAEAPSPFQRLQALVGEWEARVDGDPTVRASYRLISNGTAVMESINDPTHQDMVTIYHQDGDQIVAAHFCSSGNQPRMRGDVTGPRGETLTFSMFDVTNLTDPGDRHIPRISFHFEDRDHYTQEWTERVNGRDSVDVLHFTRKE